MSYLRAALVAIVCVTVLSAPTPARAASCNGASHQMQLRSGTASPASGTAPTTVTFSVVYASNAGCAPNEITVTVQGAGTYPLTATGSSYQGGVKFQRAVTLAAGRYAYSFRATSGSGAGEVTTALTSVNPAAVVIAAPTPQPPPPPTPKPPPPPTPKPPPPPPVTPGATPVTPPPTAGPTSGGSLTPGPSRSGSPSVPSATDEPTPTSTPSPEPTSVGGVASPDPTADDRGGGGITLNLPDLRGPVPPWLVGYLLMTGAGLGIYFALVRRRSEPDAPPVLVAATSAATAGPAPENGPVPSDRTRTEAAPTPPNPAATSLLRPDDEDEAAPGEAGVPRWLRPSVRAARQEGVRYPSRDPWR